MRALLLAFALAACSSSPPAELPAPSLPQRAGVDPIVAARAEGVVSRALGAEPDFLLHIYRNDTMIFLSWDDGAHQETFNNVRVVLPAYRGSIYEARSEQHTLRVDVRDGPCRDARLGPEVFSANVTITIDGEMRRGCGREI